MSRPENIKNSMVHLQENLTQKFVNRGSWLYIFAFLAWPIGYAIKIIVSHDLSVSEVGMLYGVLSFIILVSSFNDFGMVESLNHFVPKFIAQENYKKAKAFFVYAGVSMLVTSIFFSTILWLSANWLGWVYFWDVQAATILKYFCVYLFFSNIQHYQSNVFFVYQDTKFCKGIDVLRMITSLGFAYQIFHVGNWVVSDYVMAWNYWIIFSSIFGTILAWKMYLRDLFKKSKFVFSKSDLKELFHYSLWALLANNVSLLLSQIDIQILLLMWGAAEVGIYSNYLSLIGIPFLILSPIIWLIFPVVSSYFWAGRTKEIVTIASTFSRIFALSSLVCIGISILYASGSGIFFFGEKFKESGYVLLYSVGFLIFNFLLQINFNILGAIWQVKKRLKIVSLGLMVNIALNIVCIYYMLTNDASWASGSAFAVGVSWIFIWYLSYRATQEYHEPFLWKNFLKNLVFCTILTLLLWKFLPRDIEIIGKLGYFLSLLVSVFLYTAGYIFINRAELLGIYRTFKSSKSWAPPLS